MCGYHGAHHYTTHKITSELDGSNSVVRTTSAGDIDRKDFSASTWKWFFDVDVTCGWGVFGGF